MSHLEPAPRRAAGRPAEDRYPRNARGIPEGAPASRLYTQTARASYLPYLSRWGGRAWHPSKGGCFAPPPCRRYIRGNSTARRATSGSEFQKSEFGGMTRAAGVVACLGSVARVTGLWVRGVAAPKLEKVGRSRIAMYLFGMPTVGLEI